jgi:hypothetical protein
MYRKICDWFFSITKFTNVHVVYLTIDFRRVGMLILIKNVNTTFSDTILHVLQLQEKREMEIRKRREEERRRKAKEDAERRRQDEKEQRRLEEELMAQTRKKREEEAQRRLDSDSRMTTNRTNRTYRSDITQNNRDNMEDDFVKAEETYRSAPSPPKHAKPVRVKRPTGNPKHKQPSYEREESPPREFKVDLSLYADAAKVDGAYESSNVKLVPCSKCGRKFSSDRVQRHMNSCDNLTKKRKILDPTKLRTTGTDMEQYNRNPNSRAKTPPVSSTLVECTFYTARKTHTGEFCLLRKHVVKPS